MDLAQGTVVADRFRLERKLGQGAMGMVWLAQHTGLDIPCAVKFIRAEVASLPEVRSRFEREAKAAAHLRSPHVVQILDHGVWEGLPYMAMEFLEGEDLAARLDREGRIDPRATAKIIAEVARALSKAHSMGLIHRDLKPANIFLARDGNREIAKILDFGIVKDISAESQTRVGSLMGTPYYMSPEQARSSKGVDHRADLWSLGVVVYRCVTGKLPFYAAESVGDLLMQILSAPLPVPSQAAQVPPGFDAWWARAAARDPAQRFQSADEFAESLAAALGAPAGEAVAATLVSALPQTAGPAAPAQAGSYAPAQAGGYAPAPFSGSGYGGPPSTAMPPSGGMYAPPQSMRQPWSGQPASSSKTPLILGAAAVGLIAIVGIALMARKSPAKADVDCEVTQDGLACTVTHREGKGPTGVCWDVKSTCANGAVVTATGCQNVPPGGKSSLLILQSQFKGGKCDRLGGWVRDNVRYVPPGSWPPR